MSEHTIEHTDKSRIAAAVGSHYIDGYRTWDSNPFRKNRWAVFSGAVALSAALVAMGHFALLSSPVVITGVVAVIVVSLVLTESPLCNRGVFAYIEEIKKQTTPLFRKLQAIGQDYPPQLKTYHHNICVDINGLEKSKMLEKLNEFFIQAKRRSNFDQMVAIFKMIEILSERLPTNDDDRQVTGFIIESLEARIDQMSEPCKQFYTDTIEPFLCSKKRSVSEWKYVLDEFIGVGDALKVELVELLDED